MSAATHPSRPSLDERVEVTPYNSVWSAQAEKEIAKLRSAPGRRAREIEPIGSTAVPGLAAKPIIDLQAGIVKPASVGAPAPILAAAGCEDPGEAGVPGRCCFLRRQPPFPVSPHVLWSRELWRQNLAFRDDLRAHPQETGYYGRQKREILAQGGSTLLIYSDAKAPLPRELAAKARAWARQGDPAARQIVSTLSRQLAKPGGTRAGEPHPLSAGKEIDRERALEAFYGALTAAIRLGDEAGFDAEQPERLRKEAAEGLAASRNPATATEVRSFEEHLRTAGLIYLLDPYCDERGRALEPRERRKLKSEAEAWQIHLRDLEDCGEDFLASTPELAYIATKEDLAKWFGEKGIGRYRLPGR